MRIVENRQMKIGQCRVENIKIDERERDEIPQLLRGLQKIYCNPDLKKKNIFTFNRNVTQKCQCKHRTTRYGFMENISNWNHQIELQLEL